MSLQATLLVPLSGVRVPECPHGEGCWGLGGGPPRPVFGEISDHGPRVGTDSKARTGTRTRHRTRKMTLLLSSGHNAVRQSHMAVPRTQNKWDMRRPSTKDRWELVSKVVALPGSSLHDEQRHYEHGYYNKNKVRVPRVRRQGFVPSSLYFIKRKLELLGGNVNVVKCLSHLRGGAINTPHASDSSSQIHLDHSEGNDEGVSAGKELWRGSPRFGSARKLAAAFGTFFMDQYLPIVLISAIVLGFLWPVPGSLMRQLGFSNYMVFGIFFISGMTLRAGEVKTALAAWKAWAYGMVAILALTPLAGAPILRLPVVPKEFSAGLAVFCCMPTTLSSGVSLTQAAGANTAIALGLTVASNLLGIFTVPFTLSALLGSSGDISLSPKPLLISLLQTILCPLLMGLMVRSFIPGAAQKIDESKRQLSIITSTMLSAVPFMQVSTCRSALLEIGPFPLVGISVISMCLHLFYLASNTFAVRFLRLGKMGASTANFGDDGNSKSDEEEEDNDDEAQKGISRAVILVASQKTLPVSVAVIDQLGGVLGQAGLLVLPCVAAHFLQVILDSILVGYWLRSDRSSG